MNKEMKFSSDFVAFSLIELSSTSANCLSAVSRSQKKFISLFISLVFSTVSQYSQRLIKVEFCVDVVDLFLCEVGTPSEKKGVDLNNW